MCLLVNLPAEMLCRIIEFVPPTEGLEALTLCSKHLNRVGEKVLHRHREMKKRYSRPTIGSYEQRDVEGRWITHDGTHATQFLQEIHHDTSIASYVTDITMGYLNDRDDNGVILVLDGCRELNLRECIHAPYEVMARKFDSHFKKGQENLCGSCAMALILSLLPNLRKLDIIDVNRGMSTAMGVISAVGNARSAGEDTLGALNKLEEIHLTVEDGPTHLFWLKALAGLPRFRSLFLGDLRVKYYGRGDDGHRNGLRKLRFIDHQKSTESLCDLVESTNHLEEFTYKLTPKSDGGRTRYAEWKPWTLIGSLLLRASHSLVRLDMTYHKSDELPVGAVGSLLSFQKLAYMRLDHTLLIGPGESDATSGKAQIHSLVDVLPSSIQSLVLTVYSDYHQANQMLANLPKCKHLKCPNLKSIQFETDYPGPMTEFDVPQPLRDVMGDSLISRSMTLACRKAGIDLTILVEKRRRQFGQLTIRR